MAATKAISGIEGAIDVKVDLKTGVATYDETKAVDPTAVAEAIKKAGFEVVK
jgi:copper chaperone CopZ